MPEIKGTSFACRLLHDTRLTESGNGQSEANHHLRVPLIRFSPVPALMMYLILCLSGCSRPAPVRTPDPVRALASVYVMGDIVHQIGDDRVRVEWFIESGQPLDPVPATPEHRQQWLGAALVLTRGLPEPWTYQGAGDAYQDRRILRVDMLPSARNDNPMSYMWLDPRVGIEIAQEVTDRLISRDPRSEAFFRSNCDEFVKQIQGVMKLVSATTKASGAKPFVSLDPGFDPLAGSDAAHPYTGQNTWNGIDYGPAPNNGAGFYKDLSGNELPNAPHFTTSISAEYSMPVTSEWAATLHGDFYWQSGSWARVFNDDPYDKLHGYKNVNLALILTNQDGWQAVGYLKNVFNVTAITGTFLNSDDSGLTTNVFLTDPRLFGVRITKNW